MVDEIKALLIFEMLGRPAGHLEDTLTQFIDKVSKEQGVEILNKKIHEPKKVEEAKQEIFTTFAETEMNFKNLNNLLKIVFTYMPSHIEIVSPEELKLKNFELNELINELVRRLHRYDEITKALAIERNILQKQLQQQGVQSASVFPQQQRQAPIQLKAEETKEIKNKKAGKKNNRRKKKR